MQRRLLSERSRPPVSRDAGPSRKGLRPARRCLSVLVSLGAVLAATGVLSAPARAQDPSFDGCTVFATAPNFFSGVMHYSQSTKCSKVEFRLTSYIQNEWFKPGANTDSWSNSASRECFPQGNTQHCSVSNTGPYKGPGKYCTVAMTDIWFVNRIAVRSCAVYG